MAWIWEREDWTNFRWNPAEFQEILIQQEAQQHAIQERLLVFGISERGQQGIDGFSGEVQYSSDIEGEYFNPDEVRSSVARRLGIDAGSVYPADRRIEGVVEVVLDAVRAHDSPLTQERLWNWHRLLFPEGRTGIHKLECGQWRTDQDGPMRVISGPMGREKEHYRAPPAACLDAEMAAFLQWFEDTASRAPDSSPLHPVLKSAIAHLRFVSIHPFEDGNGRIARAIADMQLARAETSRERWYSMSAAIRKERRRYYELLEATQRGDGDIAEWLHWYLGCRDIALQTAWERIEHSARVLRFWARCRDITLNQRQRHILNLLVSDFEGKLTSSKWATLTKCSQDSANRDIKALVDAGLLAKSHAGGRSTSYEIVWQD